MGGGEHVHERQGGLHAARLRAVAGVAEQRVEPDHQGGAALDLLHAATQQVDVAGVPAVAQNGHHGAAVEGGAPVNVQVAFERCADAGAAGPLRHGSGQAVEGRAQVGSAQLVGDAVQAGAEHERLDAPVGALEGEHELDQETAVQVHRLADVADQRQLQPPLAAAQQRQVEQLARPQPGAQGAAQVEPDAARTGLVAARQGAGELPADGQQQVRHLLQLVRGQQREVGARRHLLRAVGGGRHLPVAGQRGVSLVLHRLLAAPRDPQRRQDALRRVRVGEVRLREVVPVDRVAGVEHLLLVAILGGGGAQRHAEPLGVRQGHHRGPRCVSLLAQSQRDSRLPQVAAKADHPRRQGAFRERRPARCARHRTARRTALRSRRPARRIRRPPAAGPCAAQEGLCVLPPPAPGRRWRDSGCIERGCIAAGRAATCPPVPDRLDRRALRAGHGAAVGPTEGLATGR